MRAARKALEAEVTLFIAVLLLFIFILFNGLVLVQNQATNRDIENPLAPAQERSNRYGFDVREEANIRNSANLLHVMMSYEFDDTTTMKEKLQDFMYCVGTGSQCETDQDEFDQQFGDRIGDILDERNYKLDITYQGSTLTYQSSSQTYDSGPAEYYMQLPMPGNAAELHLLVEGTPATIEWQEANE